MQENIQVVYVHPPTEPAPLDADATFHVVKTPLETDAVRLQPNEVLLIVSHEMRWMLPGWSYDRNTILAT